MGGIGKGGPGSGGFGIIREAQNPRQAGDAAPSVLNQLIVPQVARQAAYRTAVVAPFPSPPSIAAFTIKLGVIISVIHIIVVKSFRKVMIECFEDMNIKSRVIKLYHYKFESIF